jgi:hypothetical protein
MRSTGLPFFVSLSVRASLSLPLLFVAEAHAEEVSADSKAAARELAASGIADAKAGRCDLAVPKLERAERLYHAPTILTALGECQVQLGRLVEGSENLKRVTLEQLDPGASSSFVDAKKKAKTLLEATLPKIAKLTIVVKPEGIQNPEVKVDGTPINKDLLGIGRPTDPGEHTISIQAEGYRPAEAIVQLDPAEQETLTLELVAEPKPAEPSPATAAPVAPVEPATPPAPSSTGREPSRQKSAQPVLGWIGIGVGAAAMIAGGVTGGLAMSESDKLNCPRNICAGEEADRLDRANGLALASSVLFGAGGVLAVTGIVLLVTSPTSPHEPVSVVPSWTVSKVKFEPQLHLTGISVTARY